MSTHPNPAGPQRSAKAQPFSLQLAPEHALQTLLAFSSLHQQIREKRERATGNRAHAKTVAFALQDVLQLVAERVLSITEASGTAIALGEGDEIVCRAAAGDVTLPVGLKLNPQSGFTAICFRTGQVVRCDDTEVDTRVDREACRMLGIRSLVAVPLRGAQGVMGVLEAFGNEPLDFSDTDVRSLNLLGELIVEALREDEGLELPTVTAMPAIVPPPAPAPPLEREAFLFASLQPPPEPKPWARIAVLTAIVGALLAGTWWWLARNKNTPVALTPPSNHATESTDGASAHDESGAGPAAAASGPLLAVTGIRHWTNADSSTVVIDLAGQVPYEVHRLTRPDRIYFDLPGTVLSKDLVGKTFEIGDALLARVRAAQPAAGVTRVVLETSSVSNFSVSMEPDPYRLVVEVRSVQAPPRPKMQGRVFLTPSAAAEQEPVVLTREDRELRAHVPHLRVVVDAGHGGWDLGTMGRQGLLEKDLVLEIAQRVGQMLEQRMGMEVIFTRGDDTYVPLERRAAIANQSGADLFVSVHANYSSESTIGGVETYYTSAAPSAKVMEAEEREVGPDSGRKLGTGELREKSESSRRLAVSVQRAITAALTGQGVRNRGVKAASFVVLTGTTMPSILTEVSFISSPDDARKLQDPRYRQQIAEAIYQGVARYAAHSHQNKVASASRRTSGF
jgi:N-acetylmuramoyl-L-alanine amidase